jgi:hypothetical protein
MALSILQQCLVEGVARADALMYALSVPLSNLSPAVLDTARSEYDRAIPMGPKGVAGARNV